LDGPYTGGITHGSAAGTPSFAVKLATTAYSVDAAVGKVTLTAARPWSERVS
jgi:hypothetical protein